MHFALLLLMLVAATVQAALPEPVTQALKTAGIPEQAVSVYARRVDAPQPLLAERAERPMNPASVMKLVTTYAGLELLGPAYSWRTELLAAKAPVNGVIDGDLTIKGYGDPTLTQERFWLLVHALRTAGVREIHGGLVLDRGYFAPMAFDPGAFDGDAYRPYNAGPDALLVNFKVTDFHVREDNGHVSIVADPALPQVEVVNRVKLQRNGCGDWKNRLHYEVRESGERISVVFSGDYAADCGEKVLDLSLPRHPQYVSQLFDQLWREQGGTLSGQWREGQAPAEPVMLAQQASLPLADAIRWINKYSNNLMARQLYLTLGAESRGQPATPALSEAVMRAWLAGKGLDFPELVLENGAGLSRNERISARHLGELLLAAYAAPTMPEYISSLPVYAVDGTLRRRSQASQIAGRAHLKSGSLDDVRAVAGYLLDAQGRRWVVVLLINDARAGASKPAQEALLDWLYRQP